MSREDVRAYYDQYGEQEWERLARPTDGVVERVLVDGVFLNDRPGAFTGGYGFRPEEVEPSFARHGFRQVALLASEGFAPDLQNELATLATRDSDAYQAAIDILVRTAADPSILGMSHHLLYVGQKSD